MSYRCIGGPKDGQHIALSGIKGRWVEFPVMPEARVVPHDELEWEIDPFDGRPRIKRPPFGVARYRVEGDTLVYEPEGT